MRVIAFALAAQFGVASKTAFAQLHPLSVGYTYEHLDVGFSGPFAVASHNISATVYPQIGGYGSTIGVAYASLSAVDVMQGQWRLIPTGPVSSLQNVNPNCVGGPPLCPSPLQLARQAVLFSGFDLASFGFPSVIPSYSTLRSSASPIALGEVSTGEDRSFSVDVTDYMRSLPTYVGQFGNFVMPGFVMELQPVHSNGNWVLFYSLSLENRDGSFDNPWLPIDCEDLTCRFESVPSRIWVDPPVASGFEYQMTGGSLFTHILDFPPGFDSLFTVSVDGVSLGQFGPGESVDFTSFPGGGVSRFIVSGISPVVDPTNQLAFPLQLQFDTPTASFNMIAIVPEPSSSLILLSATVAVVVLPRWGKRQRQVNRQR
jgi:hypothetical protein